MSTEAAARRVLITGSDGFMGRALVKALLSRGDDVVLFDQSPAKTPAISGGAGDATDGKRVRAIRGDVRDADALADAATGCDAVFHLASVVHVHRTQHDLLTAINVEGTRNALAACAKKGVRRFVYASSASVVYGGDDIENGDESLPYPAQFFAPYAETKRIAEELVLAADNKDGVRTCALRPHVVFGPGDTRMLPIVLAAARRGLPFVVGDDRKLSDFTYVDNIVDASLLADKALEGEARAGGRAYFITNADPRPYWSFIRQILSGLGAPLPGRAIPFPLAYAIAWINEKLQRAGLNSKSAFTPFTVRYLSTHHYFNCARATAELGYRPRVSLDEGVTRTIASIRAESESGPSRNGDASHG